MTTGHKGGITAVPGVLAAGMAAGIKKGDVLDLALIVSERDATVAGVFTLNKVVAAPVLLDRQRLRRGRGRAILVNSGKDRKSTRLNSSHGYISYAVFCLKKKKSKRV